VPAPPSSGATAGEPGQKFWGDLSVLQQYGFLRGVAGFHATFILGIMRLIESTEDIHIK
jgi:hypothetical protein